VPATLQQYIQGVAEALDDYAPFVASAGTANQITLPDLIDATANASTSRYDGAHLFDLTSGQGATVRNGSYQAAVGQLQFDPAMSPAPVSGDQVVLSMLFALTEGQDHTLETTYRRFVNRALAQILLTDELALPIAPGQSLYPLSPYAYWLDREARVGWRAGQPMVTEPGPVAGSLVVPADWRRPTLRFDADLPYLELAAPFAPGTTGSLRLRVRRPADSYCAYVGVGQWVESTTGLAAMGDMARPGVADVVAIGLAEAYRALMNRGASAPAGVNWRQKYEDQLQRAQAVWGFDTTGLATTSARLASQQAAPQPQPQAVIP